MKKSRFLYLHPAANSGKIASLEELHESYSAYLEVCVQTMLEGHRLSISLKDKQSFFSPCFKLSSQIVKNVRDHAISIVSGWAASKYTTKLRGFINRKFKDGEIDEAQRSALYIIGKRLVDQPSGKVTQEAIDLYWSWLLDESIVGRTPSISTRVGMRMSEMTAVLATSKETKITCWWLGFSHLKVGKARIQLPLAASPYVKRVGDVSKGILARKTKQGRWRFEVVEKREWEVPEPAEDAPHVGVDVGINVMAATSDGELFGASLKSTFNNLYGKVRDLRANRQRQNFKENSPRLDFLESKLTGMVKMMAGEVSNKLLKAHPGAVFVVEDLYLQGCRGVKRFAYRALHYNLASKALCIIVNPAYSSQTCPSCGYVSGRNRAGIEFHCHSCGRKSHADVVGGINLLGRSEDKQVGLDDNPSVVKTVLRERYLHRRNSSSRGKIALVPSSLRLTTRASAPLEQAGTASNQVVT